MEKSKLYRWVQCSIWVLLTIACSVGFYYFVKPGENYEVCNSAACVDMANTILQSMDTTVKPCEDFYRFACGNYLKNTVLPPDKMSKSHITEWESIISKKLYQELEAQSLEGQPRVFQKAKDFYNSCMDTGSIENKGLGDMRERLRLYGMWPVLEANWDEDSFNWIEAMRRIAVNGQNYNMIIGVGVGPNDKNVNETVIEIGQPNIGVGRLVLIKGMENPIVKAYYKEMVDIAVEFGADRLQAEAQLNDSLAFEIELAKILVPPGDLRDIEKITKFMSVSELQTSYPSVNWLYLFNNIMGDLVMVTVDDKVEIYSPKYLEKLGPLLEKTPKRVLANYIIWRVVYSVRRYLTHAIEQIDQQLRQIKDGVISPLERRYFCLKTTEQFLGPIVGAAYVKKHFSQQSKEKATKLTKLFQEQLIKLIKQVEWLDPITKQKALNKVKLIKLNVGYPDELADDIYLEKYYEKLTMSSSDFLGNMLRVGRFLREKEMRRLHKPFNASAWDEQDMSSVFNWNAFYFPNANSITLYSGLLHGYTFDPNRPQIFNIATVGSVIGHELTHSVDDMGAQFDEFGNLHDWWENGTKKTFTEKANTVGNIYSTYVVEEVNMTLHAKNMQGEIIADEGGTKIAYMVLEEELSKMKQQLRLKGLESYTPKQIYWLGHSVTDCVKIRPQVLKRITEGAVHPPGEFRVNGPLRNSLQFSEAWGCQDGSYMNPRVKVNVW